MADKLPPQNIEAEKSVLGAIMIDKNAITKVADILIPEDFYKTTHKKIYSTMLTLFSKNEPIDILSVTNILKTKNELSDIGGRSYLTELINSVPSSAHIIHYAKIIREKRMLRELISISSKIQEDAFDYNDDIENLIDSIEQKLFSVAQSSNNRNYTLLKKELESAYERIEKLTQGTKALRGITTGFNSLDNYLSGLQKSDLIILGARPSLGKTALALDIARNAAKKDKVSVGIFTLEMSKEQIVDRLIAAEAQIPLWKLRTGKLNNETDFELIQASLDRLSNTKIIIDDTPSPTIMQIRSISRRLQAEHNIELLIIDYVQLIHPSRSSDNTVQQFTEISHALKSLARELDIPILALSQLNRSVDQRDRRIPRLSDLRETGSWEQDADVVLLIHRKSATKDILETQSLEDENTASIIIAKHRNGPVGAVNLKFDPEKVTFREIEKMTQIGE